MKFKSSKKNIYVWFFIGNIIILISLFTNLDNILYGLRSIFLGFGFIFLMIGGFLKENSIKNTITQKSKIALAIFLLGIFFILLAVVSILLILDNNYIVLFAAIGFSMTVIGYIIKVTDK